MKTTEMELTKLIEQLTKKIEVPKQNSNCNYVPQILNNLIKKDYYNAIDIFYIEKLSFKFEINPAFIFIAPPLFT